MSSSLFSYYRNVFIASLKATSMVLEDHHETRNRLYAYFERVFPGGEEPREDALRYVMTNREGKLARPLMVIQVARAYNADVELLPHATAVELVHRMSLILDDCPSQDNSRLRQGKPSCWVYCADKYGIGTREEKDAMGVALTGMVANLMTGTYAPRLIDESDASGPQKQYIREALRMSSEQLVDGQCLDLGILAQGRRRHMSVEEHLRMFQLKTGTLYATSAQIGAKLGNASDEDLRRWGIFGRAVGIAYQMVDDWRDMYSTEKAEGKPIGQDAANGRKNLAARMTAIRFKDKVTRLRTRALKELRDCSADKEVVNALAGLVGRITEIPK